MLKGGINSSFHIEIVALADDIRGNGRKFIAHCAPALSPAGKRYLAQTLRAGEDALILIGPEGDFSPAEIALALDHGFEEITLGEQRLRTETAAVVATTMVSVVNHLAAPDNE